MQPQQPQRGRPFPQAVRARVMRLVRQGQSATAVAQTMNVSRMTVWRYRQASVAQHTDTPKTKPQGGYRHGLLDRDTLLGLARLRTAYPKEAVPLLKQRAVETKVLPADRVPSDSTLYRALREKLGFRWKRAEYRDPRTIAAAGAAPTAAAMERRQFKQYQRQGTDGLLNPWQLLWQDESNFRTNDQAHYAWARIGEPAVLLRPKGQSPTFNVMATVGLAPPPAGSEEPRLLLYWVVVPPRRDYQPFPLQYQAYEFRCPQAPVAIDVPASGLKERLTYAALEELMEEHGLALPPQERKAGKAQREAAMRRVLAQARSRGRVGLWRAATARGRAFRGGPTRPFRATAADVMTYVRDLLVPFYVRRRLQGLASVCTGDGLVGCPDGGQHFSVPYHAPAAVQHHRLLRAAQQTARRYQIASHHAQVLAARGRRGDRAADVAAQAARAAMHQAAQALERWRQRPPPPPLVDEIRKGAGYATSLARRTMVWDNASTHAAPPPPTAGARRPAVRVSFYHEFVRNLGLRGVVYLPPRSPDTSPMELVFGHVKRHVRAQCPDDGYDAKTLVQTIHEGFRRITPVMVMHFAQKCGYRFEGAAAAAPAAAVVAEAKRAPLCASLQERLPTRQQAVCVDERGTVWRAKKRGQRRWHIDRPGAADMHLVNVTTKPPAPSAPVAPQPLEGRPKRYTLGPMPRDATVLRPRSVVRQDGTYEIDGGGCQAARGRRHHRVPGAMERVCAGARRMDLSTDVAPDRCACHP